MTSSALLDVCRPTSELALQLSSAGDRPAWNEGTAWFEGARANRPLAVLPCPVSDMTGTVTRAGSCRCSPGRCARSRLRLQRGSVLPSVRTKFQVVALLAREERTGVRADGTGSRAQQAEALKRLDGIELILAQIAARDTSLLALSRRGCGHLRRGQVARAKAAQGRRLDCAPGRGRAQRACRGLRHCRPSGGASGDQVRDSWPTPSSPLTSRPTGRALPLLAGWPGGSS